MDSTSVTVVSDTYIKNNVAISISHVHSYNNNIKKTIYHAINQPRWNYLLLDVG